MNVKRQLTTIAVLTRIFPNIVQTYVTSHIIALKRHNYKTIIVSENKPIHDEIHPNVYQYKLLDDTIYINVNVRELIKTVFTVFIINNNIKLLLKLIFSSVWNKYGFKYGLQSLIRTKFLPINKIDIIHSHSLFSSYNYLFLKDIFNIPLTTTFHGLVPNNVTMLAEEKIHDVLNAGDAFFVNTVFAKNQLLRYGCNMEKIHIIPQGTNIEDFQYKERTINHDEPIIILSVGRLSIEKGFHIAIDAIAALIDEQPNIEYRIVGNGVERDNLQKQINDLNLVRNVKLYGSLSTDELLFQYSIAHIFILPSIDLLDGYHVETQGVVLQEAQASGIPVIASKTGGIPEVIKDQKTGLLFEENNNKELAEKIRLLIMDKTFYKNLSIQGRKDVEHNFRLEVISKKLIDVYESLAPNN